MSLSSCTTPHGRRGYKLYCLGRQYVNTNSVAMKSSDSPRGRKDLSDKYSLRGVSAENFCSLCRHFQSEKAFGH